MIDNYVEFFTGKKIEIDVEEEVIDIEDTKDDINLKFFKETDGYVMVPISDPISEDLRILHRGIFPTSSYFEERDRRRAKANKKKDKTYNDMTYDNGKFKEQSVKETSLHKNIKIKKKVTIIDRIKNIFAPFEDNKTKNIRVLK